MNAFSRRPCSRAHTNAISVNCNGGWNNNARKKNNEKRSQWKTIHNRMKKEEKPLSQWASSSGASLCLTPICRRDCHFRQFSADTNEQMKNDFLPIGANRFGCEAWVNVKHLENHSLPWRRRSIWRKWFRLARFSSSKICILPEKRWDFLMRTNKNPKIMKWILRWCLSIEPNSTVIDKQHLFTYLLEQLK